MTEEIRTYAPTVGITAVNIDQSGAGKIYDYFQSIGGKNFLFMGDNGYLEFVPVKEAGNPLTRYGRQLILLFKHALKNPLRPYQQSVRFTPGMPIDARGANNDFFCQNRAKDQVIWKGKHVNILYPDNPITQHHFLFATKEHRDSFKDVSKKEFLEVMDLAKRVGNLYNGEKYLLCKTGFDAGQTVFHFHLHLIIVENKVEGIYGRLKIAMNIIFNMIPFYNARLRGEALLKSVEHYKGELKCLNF
ncbi:MAG: HIT family protein [Simkaniaceae bacterium]|nr:MAG: HIT family protein [Simkaniaceae bacterium]